MSGYLQLDNIQDVSGASHSMLVSLVFVAIGLVVGFVIGLVCMFFSKDRAPGKILKIMWLCMMVFMLMSIVGPGMIGFGRSQQEPDGYTSNISRFEKAYGVKTDSFIPKDSRKESLGNLVGTADYGTREYMYLYDDNSQTVTINIDKKGRLRMISDGKVIPPSSHHHAGKLE